MTTATHIAEARASAASVEHDWDRRALDWPLTAAHTVVEVGGYKGRWALQIAERYAPRLYVFEPQPWAAACCRAVLGSKATVLEYGLATMNATLLMAGWETDGCSAVNEGAGAFGHGLFREIGAAFAELSISHIDLMLMNIEGYEYSLLPHMLDQGIYPQRLMVQFHTHADPDGRHLWAIAQRLAVRYRLAWEYGPTLMAWEAL